SQTVPVSVLLIGYLNYLSAFHRHSRRERTVLGLRALPTSTIVLVIGRPTASGLYPLPKGSQLARFLYLWVQSRGSPHRPLSVSRYRLRRADRPPHSASRAYNPPS